MKTFFMNIEYLKKAHNLGRDLIFDLDNTIINEKDYLLSAYYLIASEINPSKQNEVYLYLKNEFELSGKEFLYQKLKNKFNFSNFNLEDFKLLLHENRYCKKIETYMWFKDFVKSLNTSLEIYIITNGNISQQKNKIRLTKFPRRTLIKKIIYANEYKPKPHPDSYYALKKFSNIVNPIYIGDSHIDLKFAQNSSIEYFDVSLVKY